ncbi:MAG TPA: hypothetical protein VFI11_01285 [Anaerolineales bacterium]|nr:hypothetical protein [Anaerolineales bacterium]
MDIPLVEPEDVPRPPPEVRLREVAVVAHPDGRRLRVNLRLTPFLEKPNVDLEVRDSAGDRLASATIVETTESDLALTLHLRSQAVDRPLTLVTTVSYREHGSVDRRETGFGAASS